jgi:FtsP/CotA-like multicopper oxidase with cupredoxin domain
LSRSVPKQQPNLPFGNSFTGRYVWHCHMLDHEDNEMMLPYEVVP